MLRCGPFVSFVRCSADVPLWNFRGSSAEISGFHALLATIVCAVRVVAASGAAYGGSVSPTTAPVARAWRDALVAVLAGFVVMAVVASAGLALAGAGELPGGAFPHVVAVVVLMAAGGSVEVTGGAGFLADADASLSVLPLSVSLAGALTVGWLFLRPLHNRAVAGARELLARAVPLVLLWLVALTGVALLSRQNFAVSTGDSVLGDIGEVLDAGPTVGFEAAIPASLGFGLLWILGLLLISLLVSRRAPLPAGLVRFHAAVRPAAFAVVALLLAYVVIGIGVGLVVAGTRGHADRTLAVVLLGLPNLVWPALTLGFGGAWEGQAEGPFGLPVPKVLDEVLRATGQGSAPDLSTIDVASLAERTPGRGGSWCSPSSCCSAPARWPPPVPPRTSAPGSTRSTWPWRSPWAPWWCACWPGSRPSSGSPCWASATRATSARWSSARCSGVRSGSPSWPGRSRASSAPCSPGAAATNPAAGPPPSPPGPPAPPLPPAADRPPTGLPAPTTSLPTRCAVRVNSRKSAHRGIVSA